MNIQNQIKDLINQALKKLDLPQVDFTIEHPADESHGDYSANIAMVLAGQVKQNPHELAKKIFEHLKIENLNIPATFKVAGPGFINFFLSEYWLVDQLEEAIKQQDKYGQNEQLKDQKIMVEFTDPNPFKEFHIGHLYSNTVGESLARLAETQGGEVKRACYQGDVGMHVAKSIWGLQKKLQTSNSNVQNLKDLEKKSLTERVKFMGQAYALGATAYKEDKQAAEEIKELNKKIYQKDSEVKEIYQKGRAWSLDYFETIYKRLGTQFDFYFFESQTGEYGLKVVQEYLKKDIFKESQGAVIFPGSKYGLHDRVFINSLGLPTYEAKDLGLAILKSEKYSYDQSIIVTGNEIDEYFKVVLKALEQIRPDLRKKTHHLSHGMVKLPEGKMSSRTGKILAGEWLLDEAKSKLNKSYPDMDAKTAEMVAVGAVKYALLKSNVGTDVIFDFDKSVSFEGNSGPYLQYTFARCKSILRNSKLQIPNSKQATNFKLQKNYKLNNEELAVLRWLYQFPQVVRSAGQTYAPSQVATYLYELAQRFNSFYNKHRIIGEPEEKFRLSLTSAVGSVLKNGLHLLGIQAPEKM